MYKLVILDKTYVRNWNLRKICICFTRPLLRYVQKCNFFIVQKINNCKHNTDSLKLSSNAFCGIIPLIKYEVL